MALKRTSKEVQAPIAEGAYTATFVKQEDGKTASDTILTFHLTELDRTIRWIVNNSKILYTDENTGEEFTSEDFCITGLKRQLNMFGKDIDPLEVLNACIETPVTLWAVPNGQYTNWRASEPTAKEELDI